MINTIRLLPYSHEHLIVCSGVTKKQVNKFIKKTWENKYIRDGFKYLIKGQDFNLPVQVRGRCLSYRNEDESFFSMIILNQDFDPTDPHHMITLAHEVLHICQDFLPTYLDRNEEQEAEAYFHSYIMQEILLYL